MNSHVPAQDLVLLRPSSFFLSPFSYVLKEVAVGIPHQSFAGWEETGLVIPGTCLLSLGWGRTQGGVGGGVPLWPLLLACPPSSTPPTGRTGLLCVRDFL